VLVKQLPWQTGISVQATRIVCLSGSRRYFPCRSRRAVSDLGRKGRRARHQAEDGIGSASVAFDTLNSAKANNADVVIIDTAGRLHNKINLMNELTKIKNVMSKVIPDAPHEVLLVLDGSTGQNAFEQAKQFTAATEVNALAITNSTGQPKGAL